MRRRHPVQQGRIDWGQGDAPVSAVFGDIYYSNEDGWAESRHVFLEGNELPGAWAGKRLYTIGETGFGTGLNFLATWDLWRQHRSGGNRLHFVSVEKYPLSIEDLRRVYARWPALRPLSECLIDHLPSLYEGFHRIHLSDDVTLTLLIGDALDAYSELEAQIDCWYLDGFAPAKNPDLWTQDLFRQMARLARPGATLATYTVAQKVREGLSEAGFQVSKAPGFGRKRDMLVGLRADHLEMEPAGKPWFAIGPARPDPGQIAIVGAGIAGSAVAHAFARRGFTPTVFDKNPAPASEASGTPSAVFMPRLTTDATPEGHFFASAFLYAEREIYRSGRYGCETPFPGVISLAETPALDHRQQSLLDLCALPEDQMLSADKARSEDISGVALRAGGLYFPKAGCLRGADLCGDLLSQSELHFDARVSRSRLVEDEWRLEGIGGGLLGCADTLILCGGTALQSFAEIDQGSLNLFRGQVTLVPPLSGLDTLKVPILSGQMVLPQGDGGVAVGATYQQLEEITAQAISLRADDHQQNLSSLERVFGLDLSSLDTKALTGWAGVRCSTLDLLPMVGAVPDRDFFKHAYADVRHGSRFRRYERAQYHRGLYGLVGLGSRGFTTAHLCAELLVSQCLGEPWPVERSVAEYLHPGRFMIRALKRANSN